MNLYLAFVQLAIIFFIVLYEYKNASISIFLWATLLLMFGIPHFIAVLTQTFIYPEDVYIYASLFVIIFNLLYIMTRYLFIVVFGKWKVLDLLKEQIKDNNTLLKQSKESKRLYITLLFFFFIFNVSLIQAYGSILNTSWGLLYETSLDIYSLGLNIRSLSYFSRYVVFACGGLFVYFFYNKDKGKCILTAVIITLYTIITRNRIMILPIVIPFLLLFLIKYRKLDLKKVVLYGFLGFLVVYIVYALRLFRHYGDLATFISTFDFMTFNERLFDMLLNSDGELGLRNVFLYFIYKNNHFINFNKGHAYIRLLFMFVPTKFSFGLKPPDFAISMGSAWLGDFNNTRYSTHPTLYGDCFANFYWFGILLAIFWALFVTIIDKIVYKSDLIKKLNYITIFGSMYVIIGRGSVYNGVYLGVFSAIMLNSMLLIYRQIPKISIKT